MPRASFHTLGCKLNYAETSTLSRDFRRHGYETVRFGEASDVTVINTCTVTDEADKKCRNAIRRSLRANPESFIIVTGCMAQLRSDEIAAIPGVDAVLGASDKFNLFNLIREFSKREQTQIDVSCIDDVKTFGAAYSVGDRTRSFLKIQDGCDYSCSFCTIPMARGKSRSSNIRDVVAQARQIASSGVKEVVITGVNIGLFGYETGESLLDLLKELDTISGIDRYRISSIEPNLLTPEIVAFTARSDRFQPHFHVPLQSGDNQILAKMRRRYKRELYAQRVDQILQHFPDASIGVDVITGFPSETAENFHNTFTFLSELPVAYLHVFTYSGRPDTTASDELETPVTAVHPAEKKRRSKQLRMLSQKKKRLFYERFQGTCRPVLWEENQDQQWMYGFTDNYIRVRDAYDPARINTVTSEWLGEFTDGGCLSCTVLLPILQAN